ncbi:MAG: hypothetical protein LBT74_11400 [Acidobacteriota bacterium]|nr:hypothetical protein [Acidobacteriota bacterium]
MGAPRGVPMGMVARGMVALAFALVAAGGEAWARDFLTEAEAVLMQNVRSIDKRTGVYMDAAALRLATALDRFEGRESAPGDALEFYSQEEMLDDYREILEHVMIVVGEAFDEPRRRENVNIKRALKNLKSEMLRDKARLETLKGLAVERRREELRERVNRALDVTGGVLDGADEGLARIAEREAREAARE